MSWQRQWEGGFGLRLAGTDGMGRLLVCAGCCACGCGSQRCSSTNWSHSVWCTSATQVQQIRIRPANDHCDGPTQQNQTVAFDSIRFDSCSSLTHRRPTAAMPRPSNVVHVRVSDSGEKACTQQVEVA